MSELLVEEAAAPPPSEPAEPAGSSKRKLPLSGWIALGFLVVVLVVSFAGPLFAADANPAINSDGCGHGSGLPLYDPIQCSDINTPPRVTHLLGVDGSGRDVFSELVFGGRTSLIISVASIGIALLVGGSLGIVAGYFGKIPGGIIGGAFDVMLAFPQLILALSIVTFIGGKDSARVPAIILALSIVSTPVIGRIARSSALAWSQREFVTAAKALGATNRRIIVREVFPNVLPAMLSITFLGIAIVIVAEGALSVLGLGVPSTTVSWGQVVATGGTDIHTLLHMVYAGSVVIVANVVALNLLGDAIRRKFDVREGIL